MADAAADAADFPPEGGAAGVVSALVAAVAVVAVDSGEVALAAAGVGAGFDLKV
jgi:hypothetical protein